MSLCVSSVGYWMLRLLSERRSWLEDPHRVRRLINGEEVGVPVVEFAVLFTSYARVCRCDLLTRREE